MIRDGLRDQSYFDQWIAFVQEKSLNARIARFGSIAIPDRRVGAAIDLFRIACQLCIRRYGRGDPIDSIRDSVTQAVEMLDLYVSTLAREELEPRTRQMYERLDLANVYLFSVLLAFLVALRTPAAEVQRVLGLMDHAGEDALLDRFAVALGDDARTVAEKAKFFRIHNDLAKVFTLPAAARPSALHKYVQGWYKRMKPIYWHDNHEGGEGAYFGYWCFEAALVAMLLDIDDSALEGHPHYPGDLVRWYRNPGATTDLRP